MAVYHLDCAQLKGAAPGVGGGDRFVLPGGAYTEGRAGHKRMAGAFEAGEPLPLALGGAVVYYAGPTPAPAHLPIGSCGPTTSGRMDVYTPDLLDHGIAAMIGKGERSQAVCEAICKNGAVYLCAVGGAGALAAKCIDSCDVIAYEDLGCESVKKLHFKEFPLTVAIDCTGGNLFERS